MEIKKVALSELIPYEKNPRKNDNAVDAVANSIKSFGFKVPIVIDADNVIVCGHTRYKAALKLGLDSVPCIIADDLTPDQIKAFRLVDNKTAELANWDLEKLSEELKSLSSELIADFNFSLPTADDDTPYADISTPATPKSKSESESITFIFAAEQKQAVEAALATVKVQETFGNKNEKGNALYEIVRQWTERRAMRE